MSRFASQLRLLATGIFLVTLAAGCSRGQQDAPTAPPLLLVGLDGVEWDVVLDMLATHRLPVLESLMERGIYGELEVTKPTLSPIIWTSIATGVTAKRHGIHGFVKPARDGHGLPKLYTSGDRRAKAFWNILGDYGRRTATVGWWTTFPAERVEGVMVAQVNTITPQMRREGAGIWKGQLVEGLQGQVHPPEMEPEILGLVTEIETALDTFTQRVFGQPASTLGPVARGFVQQSEWAFRADALYHVVARKLLTERGPFDLLAVYFGGADVVGHRFWRYMHPDLYAKPPTAAERAALGDMVRAYYAYLDAVVGDLLDAAPDGASVMIVSDHGMTATSTSASYRRPTLSGGHLDGPRALLVASGPAFRRAPARGSFEDLHRSALPMLGSILDVTPTILAALGVPIAEDMDGSVMKDILDEGYMRTRPLQIVATHTEEGWAAGQSVDAERDAAAAIERLEQLRALGYLD